MRISTHADEIISILRRVARHYHYSVPLVRPSIATLPPNLASKIIAVRGIISFNICSLVNKRNQFRDYVRDMKPLAIALQETWLVKNSFLFTLRNYAVYHMLGDQHRTTPLRVMSVCASFPQKKRKIKNLN
jgi:hypothetical protein